MKNYWHCILEVDIPEGGLPDGSDLPLRVGVEYAASKLHDQAVVIDIWSGWGLSKQGAKNVLEESCKEENIVSPEAVEKR